MVFDRRKRLVRVGGLAFFLIVASTGLAQPPEQLADRAVEAKGLTAAPVFSPGEWGHLGIVATNPDDRPARLRSTVYFADLMNRQYARELWVPPHARRVSWIPIRVPEEVPTRVADVRSVGDDLSGANPKRLPAPDGRLWSNFSIPLNRSEAITGLISDVSLSPDDEIRQVIGALRGVRGFGPELLSLSGDFLPPAGEGLAALTQLVVCGDRPAHDATACAAIRDWVRRGGRLWIMLDRVQPETVHRLLEDAVRYQVVDRVGLTEIDIRQRDAAGEVLSEDAPRAFEQPVDLLRVVVDQAEIVHTVNGWPASFRIAMGRGRVVCTTLGARGWLQLPFQPSPQRAGRFAPAPVSQPPEEYAPTLALGALAADLLSEPEPLPLPPERAAPLLSEQVGYRILGRGWVWVILGGFCGAIVVAGAWLARRERLERLGWIGPAAAAAVAVAFVALGMQSRRSVPPTVAVLQQARADPGSEELAVEGLLALYQPEPGEIAPSAVEGGVLWPDTAGLEGVIHTLVWTDLDACHWEGLRLPAGMRFAEVRRTVHQTEPPAARGAFGPEGFSGRAWTSFSETRNEEQASSLEEETSFRGAKGDFARPRAGDAVLIGPSGDKLAVRLEDDGRFVAPPDAVLAPRQFLAAGLLTDEQRRRQAIYERVFPAGAAPSSQPRLAFWREPLLGSDLPEGVRQAGAALVVLPVEIEPTPPGSRAVIPSPFLTYRAVRLDDQSHSPAYINANRQWVPLQHSAETWLRFQLPEAALPLAPEQATLTIAIDAPSRPVDVLGRTESGPVVLRSWQAPHGKIGASIDRAEVLRPDFAGGIVLGLRVGSHESTQAESSVVAQAGPSWAVQSVALEVAGRAPEAP